MNDFVFYRIYSNNHKEQKVRPLGGAPFGMNILSCYYSLYQSE